MPPEVCTVYAQEQKDQRFSSKEVSRNVFIGLGYNPTRMARQQTTRLTLKNVYSYDPIQSLYLSWSGFTFHRNLVLPAWFGAILGINTDHSATNYEFVLQFHLDER